MNFIETQQKRVKQAFRDASYWENPNTFFDRQTAQTITNTLNHILESGLLKNKPMTVFSFVLKGEELEQYMRHRGHNQAVEAVKEFISNMVLTQ